MALRYPKPLNQKDWDRLVENLKKGPSPEQREAVREAVRNTKHLGIPSRKNTN